MSERPRFPLGAVARFVAVTGITAGVAVGAFESRSDNTPSYDQALASRGLTPDMLRAIGSVGSSVSDARHSLEYTSPNTNCNIRVFDVSLGGCEPEIFPDVSSALASLEVAKEQLATAGNSTGDILLDNVGGSIRQKSADFEADKFAQPITNETYSAERFALDRLETELEAASDEASDKSEQAYDDTTEPFWLLALYMFSFVGGIGSLGTGGYATYEVNKWVKEKLSLKTNK